MASWSRTLFHYSVDFMRGLKKAAAPSDSQLKEHLLSLGLWKLRSRARGKKAGSRFKRNIPSIVGNRPLLFKCQSFLSDSEHTPQLICKSGAFRDDLFTARPITRVLLHVPLIPPPKRTSRLPSFLLANVRSLRYKTDELHTVSSVNGTSIVAVTETWLNDDITDSLVSLPGYTVHRRDRTSRAGGGVALYIVSELQHKRLSSLEQDGHEAIWLWVSPTRLPRGLNCLVVAALYNPPKSSATHKSDVEVTDYLGSCLEQIERDYSHPGIIILGDTNKYKSQSLCARYSLKQVVRQVTRGNSQLDSIFTNLQSMYSAPVHLPPIGTSDHQTVLLSAGPWPSNPPQYITRRRCTPDAMRRLGLSMNTTDFTPVFDAPSPQAKVAVLTSPLEEMLDKTVPKKKVKVTQNDKPLMSVKIKQLIVERQKAFHLGNSVLYSKLRSSVAKHISNAKRWYYKNEVEQLKHSNSGQWYKSVKALMGMSEVKGNVHTSDLHTQQLECDALSDHFSSVWKHVIRNVPSENDVVEKLSQNTLPLFNIGQIKSKLRRVNGKKAAGPDDIPPWVLKRFHEELAPVLCDVFNCCLQNSIFPQQWKGALVTAVPKKARPHFPTDYRQISLVSCVGKVYEGLLRDTLLQDTVRSLSQSQHGFLPKRSTVTALIQILQTWHDALNSSPKLDIHAVFVDFSRAFDTIDHGKLLVSLADFGVRRNLWLSIRSYLEGRTQQVKWGACLSGARDVLAGVPQGGLLSPLLFVICINSLDLSLPSSVIPVKYADDLTNSEFLMGHLPGQTQRALDAVMNWAVPFNLSANGKKTEDMIISARRNDNLPVPPPPIVDGRDIERVTTFKLLGVHVSADLTWDAHVHYMLTKTRPRIYYLAAAKKAGLSSDVLVQIYLSFIRPILEYASPVWGGLPNRLSHMLEAVQKRCCRIIGISSDSLPTLSARRDEATLRTFQSVLADETNPLNSFLSRKSHSGYGLRRDRQVMTTRSRTKIHELSFIPRAVKLLNVPQWQIGII